MLTNINLSTLFLLLIFFMPLFNTLLFLFAILHFLRLLIPRYQEIFHPQENNNKVGQLETFIINYQSMTILLFY